MKKKTVENYDFKGKRALVRCDFNVPLDGDVITNDVRITASLKTINYILDNGGSVILMSHLGRPKGEAKPEYSLKPVAKRLEELLKREVKFVPCDMVVNDEVRKVAAALSPGEVMLLENVRFRKEESENDPVFAKSLADLGDVFVNDAFGTAHRAHASTVGIGDYLPMVIGFLIEKEIKFLKNAMENPQRPFVGIMGGSKVGDKIKIIRNLFEKVDYLIIGGGMAYTFFKALGYEIGDSILDADNVELAKELLSEAKNQNVELVLPLDVVVAESFSNDAPYGVYPADGMPAKGMGLDIGPQSAKKFCEIISKAQTVFWNGPMGVFEMSNFANGTRAVAECVAASSGVTIVGGGDSATAVEDFHLEDKMTHISTGGGASLQLVEGTPLPGIEAADNME